MPAARPRRVGQIMLPRLWARSAARSVFVSRARRKARVHIHVRSRACVCASICLHARNSGRTRTPVYSNIRSCSLPLALALHSWRCISQRQGCMRAWGCQWRISSVRGSHICPSRVMSRSGGGRGWGEGGTVFMCDVVRGCAGGVFRSEWNTPYCGVRVCIRTCVCVCVGVYVRHGGAYASECVWMHRCMQVPSTYQWLSMHTLARCCVPGVGSGEQTASGSCREESCAVARAQQRQFAAYHVHFR